MPQKEVVPTVEILDKMTVFVVDIPGVAGIVKINRDNVPLNLQAELPEELLKLEARVFDPEALRVPGRLRMRIGRMFRNLGTQFMVGWLVPNENAGEARTRIAELEAEYTAWVSPFLDRIGPLVEEQCAKFPKWQHVIRACAPTRDDVAQRLVFKKRSFQIRTSNEKDAEDLQTDIRGLPGQIAQEIADITRENWSEVNGERSGLKFRSTLSTIRKKVHSLSYLHPKLRSLTTLIDQVSAKLPTTGQIEGADVALVRGLRYLLLDPREILGDQRLQVEPGVVPTDTASVVIPMPKVEQVAADEAPKGLLIPSVPAEGVDLGSFII